MKFYIIDAVTKRRTEKTFEQLNTMFGGKLDEVMFSPAFERHVLKGDQGDVLVYKEE